jgi:peptidoglycan/xylan/chitin deacetylase (PgdA/CDA1 family)
MAATRLLGGLQPAGESRAPSHRLLDLRFRHPIRFSSWPDHTDSAIAWRVWGNRLARILDFLKSRGISATWFIPGFTIESWPRECEAVVGGGHEVAHRSWAHIPPTAQTREEEEADLVPTNDAVARLSGCKARGYRSPSWDLSEHTIDLLLRHGFRYDSSLMGSDYLPYRLRRGDVANLGQPFRFGEETALIEMPISWSLDDYPHFEFVRTASTILPGLQPARVVMESWMDAT